MLLLYTPDSSGPVGRTYHVDGLVPKLFVFKLSWYHLGYTPRPWGLGLGLTEANMSCLPPFCFISGHMERIHRFESHRQPRHICSPV